MTDAEALQRFVLAAAELEPDLARWTAASVWRGLAPSRRRRIRDDLLRQAALLLPPVSTWQKAQLLAELVRRPPARPGVSTAGGLVALAAAVYRLERRDRELSARQVFRVLVSAISPVAMAADEDADFPATLHIFEEPERP